MSTRLTTSGTFKAQPTDWGVTETNDSGLPQYYLEFTLHELWDADTEEWVDYTEQDETHSDYFCLYGKKGQELLSAKQIVKVFGWSGNSFAELAELDVSEIEFQVRIVENDAEYADKRPFKAEWLDVADAIPGSGVAKLDASGLSALDKKYAISLKKGGTKVAAKSAVEKPAAVKPKAAPEKLNPEAPDSVSKEQKQDNMAAKAKKNRAALAKEAKAKEPARRPRPGAKVADPVEFPALDGDTAWVKICEAQSAAKLTDEDAEKILYDVEVKVTGAEDFDDNTFTDEQWGEIAVRTIADIQTAGK